MGPTIKVNSTASSSHPESTMIGALPTRPITSPLRVARPAGVPVACTVSAYGRVGGPTYARPVTETAVPEVPSPEDVVAACDPTDAAPVRTPGLSPSRANDYLQCPLLFRFRVVDRLPEPPSAAAVRGTLVHSVLERLFDAPAGSRTLEAARALLDPCWEQMLAERPECAEVLDDAAAPGNHGRARCAPGAHTRRCAPRSVGWPPRHRRTPSSVPSGSGRSSPDPVDLSLIHI